jgi:hypothetical protein
MDNLRQLMAAYFHQDWFDEYGGSWQAAVEDFARRETSRVEGAVAELSTLTRTTPTDVELVEALDALGSFYWAGDDPAAYRAWLEEIKALLKTQMNSRSAAPVTLREV